MSENSPDVNLDVDARLQSQDSAPTTARDAYNMVTDTAVGLNFRKSDNVFQVKCVLAGMTLFGVVGAILAFVFPNMKMPWYGGLIVGGFAGVVIGIFFSGIFLMIYRAIRHLRGEHD